MQQLQRAPRDCHERRQQTVEQNEESERDGDSAQRKHQRRSRFLISRPLSSWHCRATKAFAAPAARKNQAEAWNRVRKLRTLSSLKVRPARPLAAKEYHRMARLAPRK